MNFVYAISASVIVSLISLVGVVGLLLKEDLLDQILLLLVGFAAGGLIGGAFFDLLPEALEQWKDPLIPFGYTIVGFVFFFVLEKYLYWRHCHHGKCETHPFTYLNIVGDGIHNFIDGLIIGASFFVDVHLGVVTTVAIVLHEIPHELGNFGVLLYGGFGRMKALAYNFLSATTAILGTIIGYAFSAHIGNFSGVLIPVAAGGFIYIACCDLIPELHKQPDIKKATASMGFFLLGILMILGFTLVFHH